MHQTKQSHEKQSHATQVHGVAAVPKVLAARFLASASELVQLPAPAFAEVAFAGRSNVGKSSLINSLLQRRKLVRTSSTPGCTRGLNLFRINVDVVNIGQACLDFVDLPGYGYAKRSKTERRAWGELIEGFLETRAGLRAVVVIVDIRRGVQEEDQQLVAFLEHLQIKPVVVATKLDKLAMNQRKPALRQVGQQAGAQRVLGYSSESGEGRAQLWDTLLKAAAIEYRH